MVQESIIDVCKPLLRKPEVMDRRKGLLAISAIVRGYTPGMVIVLKDPELMSSVLAQVQLLCSRKDRLFIAHTQDASCSITVRWCAG